MELSVDIREIARYMRMGPNVPEGELAGRVAKFRDAAMEAIRPARVWRRFPIENGAISSGALRIKVAGSLANHLAGCRAAYLACGTIGTGFDALQRRLSVASGADTLAIQAVGAALVEKLMDLVCGEIRADLAPRETILRRYSPGYGDFPLEEQRTLLGILDAARTVGVSLTGTFLMVPSKSVSAVIGVRRTADGARIGDY